MILAMMMVMTISANAMSYNAAKHEALFLSDKMAYELNLTAAQYEAVYEINLDYLMSLNGHGDVFGIWWDRRNADLRFVLNSWQYEKYVALSHFYRPVAWKAGGWTFAVTLTMAETVSTMHIQRCSLAIVAVITEFMAHTMLTCTSQQLLTMLLQCTILPQLHITQRLL